ncbi:MAG: outer membrane beta-barrel protein [Cyclobacteriaceae bacterium]
MLNSTIDGRSIPEITVGYLYGKPRACSVKGFTADYEDSGLDFETSNRLFYIDVPVLFRYYVSDGFNVFFGPRVGINIGGETEDLSTLMLGINGGVGYQLESGLIISAGYDLGLTDIFEEGESIDAKNGVVQISVGYAFN